MCHKLFLELFWKGQIHKERSRYKKYYFLLTEDGEMEYNLERSGIGCYDDQLGNGSV